MTEEVKEQKESRRGANAVKGVQGFVKMDDVEKVKQEVKIKNNTIPLYNDKKRLDFWSTFAKSRTSFRKKFFPHIQYKGEMWQPELNKPPQIISDFEEVSDFANYWLATDDSFETSGSGEDLSGSWSEYQYLAEKRIGIGNRITRFPAEDAIKEGFKFIDAKTKEVVPREDIDQWLKDTDFLNEFAQAIYYERVYGISFLIMYHSEDDKTKNILHQEYKKSEGTVKAFEALPPTILSPIDNYKSDKLNRDPQKWTLMGGYYNPQQIHYSRVRTLMSRSVANRWYGASIFEPIWDSIMCYYQALLFLLRGFSKWGNMIVKYIIPGEDDITAAYNKHAETVEEMKMNCTLIGTEGTTIDFENTQIATGLREMLDIWIEDIASGTGVPVPLLMGRVVATGLGNNGYAIMERYYNNTIRKIQRSFTDDVVAILEHAGFDLKGLELDWNLSITKTDQQRLADELMEREIKLADIEIEMAKLGLQEKQLMIEAQEFQNLTMMMGGDEEGEETATQIQQSKQNQKDFAKLQEEARIKRDLLKEKRLKSVLGRISKEELMEALGKI